MKPGDLVQIRQKYKYDKNGGFRNFDLFETGRFLQHAFPANQAGIFISKDIDNGVWVTVNVNGITGSIQKRYIEVVT